MIGSIIQWGGHQAPDGWLLCDGSAVSRTTYADLFSVIGTTYGAGDGSTTFNLPDLRGRVGVGRTDGDYDFDTLGETGGSKYLQKHNHMSQIYSKNYNDNKSLPSDRAYAYTFRDENGSWAYTPAGTTDGQFVQTTETLNTGSGNAQNLQPYIVTNYIIKATIPDTIKISELESASSIDGTEVLPIVQNGETKKIEFGNIVENGSNNNGKYIKYGDGTLICYSEIEIYSVSPNSSETETWTFPVEFYNNKYVCFSELCDGGAYWASLSTKFTSRTTTNVMFEVYNTALSGTAGDTKWYVIAIGRWK